MRHVQVEGKGLGEKVLVSKALRATQRSPNNLELSEGLKRHEASMSIFFLLLPHKGQTYASSGTFPSITFKITICQNVFINLETCPICWGIIGYSDADDNKVPNKPGQQVTHGLSLCTWWNFFFFFNAECNRHIELVLPGGSVRVANCQRRMCCFALIKRPRQQFFLHNHGSGLWSHQVWTYMC